MSRCSIAQRDPAVLTEEALVVKGLPGSGATRFERRSRVRRQWRLLVGLIAVRRVGQLRLRIGAGVLGGGVVGPMVPVPVALAPLRASRPHAPAI